MCFQMIKNTDGEDDDDDSEESSSGSDLDSEQYYTLYVYFIVHF